MNKVQSHFSYPAAVGIVVLVTTAFSCASLNGKTINVSLNGRQSNNSQNMNQANAKNVEVKSDIEALGKLINLPVRPSEVKWTAETLDNSKGAVPGPTDYRLTALLKYDEKGVKELVERLAAETPEKSLGNTDVSQWFPEEVKGEEKTLDGRSFLEGAKYQPDSFFRAPYTGGKLIRVGETNYFVLNLFSF